VTPWRLSSRDVQCFNYSEQIFGGHECAVVRPFMKNPTSDPSHLNSDRPISNLSFVSKILERVIDSRIADHANRHCLFFSAQSAYRRYHSTDTDLVKIHKYLRPPISRVHRGHVGVIALLDLSSAFDNVDHLILFGVLQNRFGVIGSAH